MDRNQHTPKREDATLRRKTKKRDLTQVSYRFETATLSPNHCFNTTACLDKASVLVRCLVAAWVASSCSTRVALPSAHASMAL